MRAAILVLLLGFLVCGLAIAAPLPVDNLTDPGLTDQQKVEMMTRVGKRNLDWLKAINLANPQVAPIMVSDPSIRPSYPVDAPKSYSPKLIWDRFQAALPTLSPEMQLVLSGAVDPAQGPLDVASDVYTLMLRQVERIRQDTQRWTALSPYMNDYIANQNKDVRGYLYLQSHPAYGQELPAFAVLNADLQDAYRLALIRLCVNLEEDAALCQGQFDYYRGRSELLKMATVYLPKGKRVYDSFFRIDNPRPDAVWDETAQELRVPVRLPDASLFGKVRAFIVDNIEDEYRFLGWKLKLVDDASSAVNFLFEADQIPHVNSLGGSFLTMDSLIDTTEFIARWTIRHEFGHVLGFPDCYIEFFDQNQDAFVSYQIDTTNLMCSRAGNFLPAHFDELKRAYH